MLTRRKGNVESLGHTRARRLNVGLREFLQNVGKNFARRGVYMKGKQIVVQHGLSAGGEKEAG
jgi:hypothetical protein